MIDLSLRSNLAWSASVARQDDIMGLLQSLTIDLPLDLLERVQARVDSGEYASASELVQDSLRRLDLPGSEVEAWLGDEVATSFDAYQADRSIAIEASAVSSDLDRRMHAHQDKSRNA